MEENGTTVRKSTRNTATGDVPPSGSNSMGLVEDSAPVPIRKRVKYFEFDDDVELPITSGPTLVLVQMPRDEEEQQGGQGSTQQEMGKLTVEDQIETEPQSSSSSVNKSQKVIPKATATTVQQEEVKDAASVVMNQYLNMEIKNFMNSLEEEDMAMHPEEADNEETLGRDRADLVEDGEDAMMGAEETKGKKQSYGRRGRGKGKTKDRPDPFDTTDYKRQNEDPTDLCPYPPPKKLKGGNRTRQRDTLSTSVPEGGVQLACVAFKRNEISKTVESHTPLIPFQGTLFTPILRAAEIYDRNLMHQSELVARALSKDSSEDKKITVESIRKTQRNKPFDLNDILNNALLISLTRDETMDDSKWEWLMKLGHEFSSSPQYRSMQFQTVLADEEGNNRAYDEGVFYFDTFAAILRNLKFGLLATINDIFSASLKVCTSLSRSKANVQDVTRQKYIVREKYEELLEQLNVRDSKFDEMSITGVRCIKLLMDGPYLKTEDGLLSFQLPLDNFALTTRNELPFLSEKQKWTSKDLLALKQIIKECVLSKRINDLNARYLEHLHESDLRRAEEMHAEGKSADVIYQAPQKRRRGRPTKEETSQRDKYGIVYPVIFRHSNIVVAYSILPKQLSEWRILAEKRLRNMSFDTLMKEKDAEAIIDWDEVALKIMIRTKKLRLAADCQLTYKHEADPMVNNKRLTAEETKKVKDLYQVENKNWDEIAVEINRATLTLASEKNGSGDQPFQPPPLHTPYQYFARYMSRVAPPAKPEWDEMMDEIVKAGLEEHPGHWRRVAALLRNEAVTKKVVVDRYKKAITPRLKVGSFSRVEDCLLLLAIQRLQSFLGVEGHFGSLLAYLPWRYETTWRDRAHNLFNDWIVPWTLEEDRLLMDLAKTMNRNWQKISEQFISFKNRKGCLTRFKILNRNLEGNKNSTLEEYHEAYAMTRYNVFQYRHLQEILTMLITVRDNIALFNSFPVPPRFMMNPKRTNPPTEVELKCMLVTYDRTVLNDTIFTLEKYVAGRDAYWEIWKAKNGDRKRTFDRRTFHPEDPKSVASAIHIRGLKLKPKSDFSDLNDFEQEIYLHFGRFCRTKELKENTDRPYLPPTSFFIKWISVQRIIDDQNVPEEDKDTLYSKKWIRLMKKSTDKGQKKVEKGKNQRKRRGAKRETVNKRKKKDEYTSEEEESEEPTSESENDFEAMDMSESE